MRRSQDLVVREEDLVQEIPLVRATIKTLNLHTMMQAACPGAYGLDSNHLAVLDILEHSGALILEVRKRLRHRIASDREAAGFAFSSKTEPVDEAFLSYFSVFVATESAAARCQSFVKEVPEITGGFGQSWVKNLRNLEGTGLIQTLVGEFSAFLDHHRHHPEKERRVKDSEAMASCALAFFTLLANGVNELARDAEFERHLRALEQLAVDICGRHYRGLHPIATSAEDEEPGELLPILPEDIVGNQEYLEAGLRLARDVAGFDLATGNNPKKLNPVLFGQGSPVAARPLPPTPSATTSWTTAANGACRPSLLSSAAPTGPAPTRMHQPINWSRSSKRKYRASTEWWAFTGPTSIPPSRPGPTPA